MYSEEDQPPFGLVMSFHRRVAAHAQCLSNRAMETSIDASTHLSTPGLVYWWIILCVYVHRPDGSSLLNILGPEVEGQKDLGEEYLLVSGSRRAKIFRDIKIYNRSLQYNFTIDKTVIGFSLQWKVIQYSKIRS